MTKDTPTPRTDALVEANRGKPCSQSVDCEFARTLERDLTACRAALRELVECKDMGERTEDWCNYESYTDWRADREAHAHRQPLAWAAARAILQSVGEGERK